MSLKGGRKRMWLREHRDEVLSYLKENGEEATKREYHLTHNTLDRVIEPERRYYPRFTRYDELELKLNISEASVVGLRGEVSELKEQFAKFQDSVAEQIKQNFFLPLLQAGIRLPGGMDSNPEPDCLIISDLIEQIHNRPRLPRIGPGDNE